MSVKEEYVVYQLPQHGHSAVLMVGSSEETSSDAVAVVNCCPASEEDVGRLVATSNPAKNEMPKAMNFVIVSLSVSINQRYMASVRKTPFAGETVHIRVNCFA